MHSEIVRVYGNKVRLRICGLCWQNDNLLMVNHRGITNADFWAPPGGGIEFGETTEETLKREFWEETNLAIVPGEFRFGCQLIKDPLHAVELFFSIREFSGELKSGYDPELQLIREVAFRSARELWALSAEQRHGILSLVKNPDELRNLSGFYTI